jgi:hypothetical protein
LLSLLDYVCLGLCVPGAPILFLFRSSCHPLLLVSEATQPTITFTFFFSPLNIILKISPASLSLLYALADHKSGLTFSYFLENNLTTTPPLTAPVYQPQEAQHLWVVFYNSITATSQFVDHQPLSYRQAIVETYYIAGKGRPDFSNSKCHLQPGRHVSSTLSIFPWKPHSIYHDMLILRV